MSSPARDNQPEQIELPPPRRTLLQRLALWVQHAHALKGWVKEARSRSAALDATFETIERDSPDRRRHARWRALLPVVPVRLAARALHRLRPRAAGKRGRVRAEADHELGRPCRCGHQTGHGHRQRPLELVGRPRLVLRARLRNESPGPSGRDRPCSGLGARGRVGEGASAARSRSSPRRSPANSPSSPASAPSTTRRRSADSSRSPSSSSPSQDSGWSSRSRCPTPTPAGPT